jgi:hypothetical protein
LRVEIGRAGLGVIRLAHVAQRDIADVDIETPVLRLHDLHVVKLKWWAEDSDAHASQPGKAMSPSAYVFLVVDERIIRVVSKHTLRLLALRLLPHLSLPGYARE